MGHGCILWHSIFFFFFLTENIALLFYSCQATFQVFNISQISLANKNMVYQDAWRRKSVSFCIKIKKKSLLHILLFLTQIYLAGEGTILSMFSIAHSLWNNSRQKTIEMCNMNQNIFDKFWYWLCSRWLRKHSRKIGRILIAQETLFEPYFL